MIESFAAEFPIRTLCQALSVKRSGYYVWRKRTPGKREQSNRHLLGCIRDAFEESRQTYGSPRITEQLHRDRISCGRNPVARLMRASRIRAKGKKPFRPRTTDSKHTQTAAPNRLEQLTPVQPDQAWVADITYIRTTAGGWLYF